MKKFTANVKTFFGIKTYEGKIPESWSEVTGEQLVAIASMYNHQDTQLNLVSKFTGMPLNVVEKMNNIELYYVLQEFDFIKDFKPRNSFIITEVNGLYSPYPKLNKFTWGQFVFVETYFEDYLDTPTDELLNLFVSHLYLRRNETFNHDICLKRAKQRIITHMSNDNKTSIIINYRLIREWLSVTYPLIFLAATPAAPATNKSTNQQINKSTQKKGVWIEIYDAIVGDDLVNSNKYATLELHRVLKYMNNKIKANARK